MRPPLELAERSPARLLLRLRPELGVGAEGPPPGAGDDAGDGHRRDDGRGGGHGGDVAPHHVLAGLEQLGERVLRDVTALARARDQEVDAQLGLHRDCGGGVVAYRN